MEAVVKDDEGKDSPAHDSGIVGSRKYLLAQVAPLLEGHGFHQVEIELERQFIPHDTVAAFAQQSEPVLVLLQSSFDEVAFELCVNLAREYSHSESWTSWVKVHEITVGLVHPFFLVS